MRRGIRVTKSGERTKEREEAVVYFETSSPTIGWENEKSVVGRTKGD
jgi:hypothetical protein